jgi:UDP-GlcNAc:undecaprenyl-phosphate GlcNAc-1-phosphate transferase
MNILLIILTFALSVLAISLLIKHAKTLGLQDIPNQRSSHKKTTPRSAGIGFIFAPLLVLSIFNFSHVSEYYFIYLSIFFITLVGVYDDKYNVSHRIKFLGLLLVAIFVSYHGVLIESLGVYFGYNIELPFWLALIFSTFAIIGFTNALNLMDGLDGLAGGLSIIMLLFYLTIGFVYDDMLMITLSSTFIISLVAFLLFNWYPAKIFMGDSGSLSLGFIIAILSIESLQYIAPSAVLFIIAMPLIDTFIVMRRRIQRGQSPFKADKNHIHHFLYKTKVNVKISVMLLLYLQLALSIVGYQLKDTDQFLSLALFILLLFIFLNMFDQRFRYREPQKKRKKGKAK